MDNLEGRAVRDTFVTDAAAVADRNRPQFASFPLRPDRGALGGSIGDLSRGSAPARLVTGRAKM